ncbi:WhiB family transcriptional regulator [Streptomyces varsoviensis]|uniref:WhiB family transcriptional regulator n=1 Tax=Streptomyces varsoviensis TaxID=67373 RepID=UPI000A4F6AC8|nr:WhiB family transcriptional regulator [Streptomyces varsoviensis]
MPVCQPVPSCRPGSSARPATSSRPRPGGPEDWRGDAACSGLPDRAVFARRREAALPALRACAVCRVRQRCLEAVAPYDNWFDGVSGGRLWRNGKEVAASDALAP